MRNARIRLAVLAAAGLLVSGLSTTGAPMALAAPSSGSPSGPIVTVAPKPATKPSTTLVVAPSMATRLHRAKVSLGALSPAGKHTDGKGRTVLTFPTTGAHPTETAITHSGGLTFKRSAKTLRLDAFRLNLNTKTLSARVNRSGRADVFLVTPGATGADAGRIRLSAVTARLLNAQSHTKRFAKNQLFGTVQLPPTLGTSKSGTTGLTITVHNHTRYTLDFVSADPGGGTLTSTPKQTLTTASGGSDSASSTDTITYISNAARGGDVQLTYRINGTELTVTANFNVPILGANVAECNQNSIVDFTTCTVGSGWHPSATWTPITNTAAGPFPNLSYGGNTWQFHKLGTSGAKALQVNNASGDDGASVTLSEATGQQHFYWAWQPVGDEGWGELVNRATGKCLERNGTTGVVDQWTCIGSDNELWRSVWNPSGGSTLQLKSTKQYLGVDVDPGSVINGTVPTLRDALDNHTSWGASNG